MGIWEYVNWLVLGRILRLDYNARSFCIYNASFNFYPQYVFYLTFGKWFKTPLSSFMDKFGFRLTCWICFPGNLIKVECRLHYQAIDYVRSGKNYKWPMPTLWTSLICPQRLYICGACNKRPCFYSTCHHHPSCTMLFVGVLLLSTRGQDFHLFWSLLRTGYSVNICWRKEQRMNE